MTAFLLDRPATPAGEIRSPAPLTPAQDRLEIVDALRAIALLGVITMNILGMVGAFVGPAVFAKASPLDLAFIAFDLVFVQGKARSAFALLFGLGFGILMARARAHHRGFTRFYLRRMGVLLLVGVGNLVFLFFGDILILYAVLGIALLACRRWSDRAVLRAGLALVLLPPLLAGIAELVTGTPVTNFVGLSEAQISAEMKAYAPIYQSGGYLDVAGANVRFYLSRYRTDTIHVLVYNLGVFGLFLLGLWTARRGVAEDIGRWRTWLRKVAGWCLPLGLALSVVYASRRLGVDATGSAHALVTSAYVGLPIMAWGYLAAFALLLDRPKNRLAAILAPTGRMALTGYLGSNAIGAFVWYGWGLGQMGAWNGAAIILFAIAIYGGLLLFSRAWLARFRFGPAEWLWRSATYRAWQPIRRIVIQQERPALRAPH